MLGTALFLLCATAIAHAELDDKDVGNFFENGCPKDDSIKKFLPHEICLQYYECVHGDMIARLCPYGLQFNADLERCDWYGNTDCHNKRSEDNNATTNELDKNNPKHARLICSSPDSTGVLVAHKKCNKFYKCLNGKPKVIKCAQGLLYNTRTEQCDWPVECGSRIRVINDSRTTIPRTNNDIESSSLPNEEIDNFNSKSYKAIPQCKSNRSDGIIVAHEFCDKFYKCSEGVAVTIKCPSSYLYNPEKKFCDWAQNVDCEGRIIPESYDSNRDAVTMENNDDDAETKDPDDNDLLDDAITKCATNNSDGMLVSHNICNHFYKCLEKKPVAFNCPGDLLFNSIKQYCDWPNNVNCGDRIIPTDRENGAKEKVEDPLKAYIICSAKDSDGVLIAHEVCNTFYKCHDEVPVVVKCPGILLYNQKTEICDWPTHVYCKDRIVPENGWSRKADEEGEDDSSTVEYVDENNVDNESEYANKNKIESESRSHIIKDGEENLNVVFDNAVRICAAGNSEEKTLPHENCNQYYKCIESKPMALFCELNLYYHPKREVCDFPKDVDCKNRIVPGQTSNGAKRNSYVDACQGNIDGAVVPSEICSQFYKCVNGRPNTMYCPPGLYFNTIRRVCDWPMNVDCGKRITEMQMIL